MRFKDDFMAFKLSIFNILYFDSREKHIVIIMVTISISHNAMGANRKQSRGLSLLSKSGHSRSRRKLETLIVSSTTMAMVEVTIEFNEWMMSRKASAAEYEPYSSIKLKKGSAKTVNNTSNLERLMTQRKVSGSKACD